MAVFREKSIYLNISFILSQTLKNKYKKSHDFLKKKSGIRAILMLITYSFDFILHLIGVRTHIANIISVSFHLNTHTHIHTITHRYTCIDKYNL